MSDISSFAEWEAQHQHSNEGDVLNERQQKLIDMAGEHRVWADRDSSNDYRSSASDNESEEGNAIKPPVQGWELGCKAVNGDIKQTAALNQGTDLRIWSSWEIQGLAMEESQALSQKLEEAHPPLNQPRSLSSSAESVDTEDDLSTPSQAMYVDEESLDDPFKEFDVIESEKEFLVSILDTAPAEEVQALREITDYYSTITTAFCLIPALRSAVEEFAHTRSCQDRGTSLGSDKNKDYAEIDIGEFKRDVFEYARAAGMGKNQAKVEVMRAVAARRKESGLGGGEELEELDEESYTELEIASPILMWQSLTPLVNSEANATQISKKRKRMAIEEAAARDFPGEHLPRQAMEFGLSEAKRLKKAAIKEKKRAARRTRKAKFRAQKAVLAMDTQMGVRTPIVEPTPGSASIEQKASNEEPAKKRKKLKLGPTTSAYFKTAQIPTLNSQITPTVVDDSVSKTPYANKRTRKPKRTAARIEAESNPVASAIEPSKASDLVEQTRPSVGGPTLKSPNVPGSAVQEVKSTQANFDHTHKSGELVLEVREEKHKRKRKRERNHNRLPKEPQAAVNTQEPVTNSLRHETVRFNAEKLLRTEASVENIPMPPDDQEPEKPSNAREKDEADMDIKLKRKRNRRRNLHSQAELAVVEELHDLLPNPDDSEMIMSDHNAEMTKQLVSSGKVKEYEGSEKKPRRERVRKAKGKFQENNESLRESYANPVEQQTVSEPLTELVNTNKKSPNQDRQHRGRARERKSDEHSKMDVELHLSREQSKAYHSNALAEEANLQPNNENIQGDGAADCRDEYPKTPEQEVSVVIYTPSKISMLMYEQPRSATPTVKQNDNDTASVFSMTNYGSLDWDHSGDESEFERASVSPKPKRRASSANPMRRRPLLGTTQAPPPKKRLRTRSCPAPVDRQKLQRRDARGRFARGEPSARKKRKPSSCSSEITQQQRDVKGRFAKTPLKPATTFIPVVENPPISEPAPTKIAVTKAKRPPATSPYFAAPISPPKTPSNKDLKTKKTGSLSKRSPGGLISCIPFPPLSAPHFGLIQEKLAHDPFRLLIAVTFLIRTHGKHAIPLFYSLMSKYPTPESLIEAEREDIVDIIRHLGLQNSRAATYQTYAKIWLEDPPLKGRRYAVKGYPQKDSGRDIPRDGTVDDEDPREAWEIGHMTSGPYALDSWRIFCRDILRGVATGWNGESAKEESFQPEWMRVLPKDKELRAYLRWMWLKEGFEWDPFTGDKKVASMELTRAAMEGRIAWDDKGGMRILDEVADDGAELVQGGLGGRELNGKEAAKTELEIPASDADDDNDMDI